MELTDTQLEEAKSILARRAVQARWARMTPEQRKIALRPANEARRRQGKRPRQNAELQRLLKLTRN